MIRLATACALVAALAAPAMAQTTATNSMDILRQKIKADKKLVVSEYLELSDAEGKTFWPVYDAYQKEHRTIIEEQLKGVQRYIEAFDTLDDAGALALIKAHLDRDERMNVLRQKALLDLQRAVGTKIAARAIQIDRRLSLVQQLEIVSKIPLIR